MVSCDILIQNIKGLVQAREKSVNRLGGSALQQLPIIDNAYLAIKGEQIHSFGPMENLPPFTSDKTIDASGRFVLPSFIDSHTHLVFAATREEEFMMKLKGASYQEIASKGGGILNSARKLRAMSKDALLESTLIRARNIIQTGTGAVEIKSGYGLTVQDELKMLRVAREVEKYTPLTVKTTLLGAHAVPEGMKKQSYISTILEEMIPAVAEEHLADYIDVFCEDGFFSMEETERIVERGKQFQLKPRIHANQLNRSGGVQVGVKTQALSVDHLENIGDEEIELLGSSKVMPTLLPWAAFFLSLPFPPARRMIQAGLPIAIASDFNPGSSPCGNMLQIISMACIGMKLSPEEVINAATINTAASMELQDTHGSITVGKMANLFITKPISSVAYIPYAFGNGIIDTVIMKGTVMSSGELREPGLKIR